MNLSDIFPWNNRFNIGIAKIDEQHQHLAKLINLLASHLALATDMPTLQVIFAQLSDYAIYHFQTEEAIWHDALQGDALELTHQDDHQQFLTVMNQLKLAQTDKSVDAVLSELLMFLTRWLAAHILENDRYLALVVLAMQSGQALGIAKITAKAQINDSTHTLIAIILAIYENLSTNTLQLIRELAEHQHIEIALRDAHQQMLSLLNSMAEGAFGVDTKGYCRFVNRSFLQILGYDSADELIGRPIHDLIHHSHLDGTPYPAIECQMYAAYIRCEEVHVVGEVFWRKDGTPVPVEYWSQPIISDNVVTGAVATFIDITERQQIEAKLADSECRLRTIIESEPECIKIVNQAGELVLMNPAGLAMVEADNLAQVVNQSVFTMIAPEYRSAFMQLHQRVLAGESVEMEFEAIGLKGGRCWFETHAVPMREVNGNVVHLAVTRDISKRKHTEQQLRIAATVFESQLGMMVTDADNEILRVNQAFTAITGYSSEELVGKQPTVLRSDQQDPSIYAKMEDSIIMTGTWEGELWSQRKNGETYPVYLTITAVKDANDAFTHFVSTLSDITSRKAAAEEIKRLAFYDPLTNLPNRRLLYERLKPALASSQRNGHQGALLFIDLDNFKTLNDTLGHDMGDLLLQEVAKRLLSCIRKGDTVARLGGDEFVVMLEDLSQDRFEAAKQTKMIGHKILNLINQPFNLTSHRYFSTPSVGATLFNGHEQSIEELLKQADIAMYQAKTSGRNALRFFDPQMQAVVMARVALEDDLRGAINKLDFQLHYQIQIEHPYRVLGAEGLIRWLHPQRGMIYPATFIALAEETGLILTLGQWVINSACAQLKAWQQAALTRDLVLAVNVSAKQFYQVDFVAQVRTAIEHYGINPALLKLELTESVLIKNIDDTIITMNALRQIGVKFALDDFGMGYSSLQYLKKLPLDELKIDLSFVRDIASDSSDQAIVCTIIAMATALNLTVIAEGVETQEQQQLLLYNGCTHYQGYLFSKPLPINQFEALLEATR